MVSADFSLRHCGLPGLSLWWTLLPHQPPLMFHEDNQAMIRVCEIAAIPPCVTFCVRTVSPLRGCTRHSHGNTFECFTKIRLTCVLISILRRSLTLLVGSTRAASSMSLTLRSSLRFALRAPMRRPPLPFRFPALLLTPWLPPPMGYLSSLRFSRLRLAGCARFAHLSSLWTPYALS